MYQRRWHAVEPWQRIAGRATRGSCLAFDLAVHDSHDEAPSEL